MVKQIALAAIFAVSTLAQAEVTADCTQAVRGSAAAAFIAKHALTNNFSFQLMGNIVRVSDEFNLLDTDTALYSVSLKGTEAETEAKFGEEYEARSQYLVLVNKACEIKKILTTGSENSRTKRQPRSGV